MLVVFALVFCICALFACVNAEDNPPPDTGNGEETEYKTNRVRFSRIPEGADTYDEVEVYLGEERLPLYKVKVNTSQVWTAFNYSRRDNGVGIFALEGKVEVTVKVRGELDCTSKVRPLSAGIIPIADIAGKTLTFEICSAGEYVVEINNNPHDAVHLFVSDYSDGEEDLSSYENVMVFEAGLHTKDNDTRINERNMINLSSNTAVIIEDGAVIRGKFSASGASNILITGSGVVDGSAFERNASTGSVTVPLDFSYCDNVRLSGFFCLDPAGWCVNFYFMEDCVIDDVKIITSRSNGDGISLQSCKRIEVDGCFVRTWDDSLVVKNYPEWSDRTRHGTTEDIVFKNCTLWTDLAQSMELGYETVGVRFTGIRFENITVLHAFHKPVVSIHNANNADITDVVFRNITVEDASMGKGDAGSNSELIDIRNVYSANWSANHTTTSLGSISGVLIENIAVINGKNLRITVAGCYDVRTGYESEHYVDDVLIKNISLIGKTLSSEDGELSLNVGEYATRIRYQKDSDSVLGARFLFSRSEASLAQYGEEIAVEIIN